METFKNNIKANHSFHLKDFQGGVHDYFLQNLKPDLAISYLHGQLFKKQELKGQIFIAIHGDFHGYSLKESPFGGIWTASNLSSAAISFFIQSLNTALKERGVKSLTVIQPPREYCNQSDLISYLLFTEGFKLMKVMNHQVFCGKKKLRNAAASLELKYSKKIKNLGFEITTTHIQSFNFLQDIMEWNQSRGYKSSITEDRLIRQVSSFPDRYFVISIYQKERAVAHALAVKLTSDSLYYFLSGINPKNQNSITGELIMTSLIKLAADLKVDFLDFGTSALEDEPNHNLMFFKSKSANEYSNKYTWQIQYQ